MGCTVAPPATHLQQHRVHFLVVKHGAVEGAINAIVDVVHGGNECAVVIAHLPLGHDVGGQGEGRGHNIASRLGNHL